MAEDSGDDESKTEAPSAKRLQQAYDEGQVPLTKDAAMVAGFGAGVLCLMAQGRYFRDSLVTLVISVTENLAEPQLSLVFSRMLAPALMALACIAVCALAAAGATVVQTKGGFWGERAMPDLTRLFSPRGVLQIFQADFWVELLLSVTKVVAVGALAWGPLRDMALSIESVLQATAVNSLTLFYTHLGTLALRVVGGLAVIAGADYAWTRHRFMRKHRMTKEEAKREYKEDEGDPMLRARRRRAHREMSKNRAAVEVPKADVLVVNPTHIAIALRYRRDEDPAPRVTAKGKDKLAEQMRELAREHGIPIMQDIPLARLLYKKVKVGRTVPADTYKAVAAVLAFVYRMTGRVSSSPAGSRS